MSGDQAQFDKDERLTMKKFFTIMSLLVFAVLLLFYFRGEFIQIADKQIKTINQTLINTTKAVTINSQNTKILAQNQNVSFANQKVIAKGLNDLGSVLITDVRSMSNDVSSIQDKTNLLSDIKFDTEKILNQTIKNVTHLADVNLSDELVPQK